MTWSFGLLRKAISKMLGKKEDADTGPTHVEAEGAIGIPRDNQEYEQTLGHIKSQKVHTFLSHSAAKHVLLVWVVVCSPIMQLHYHLFKHGRFYSHRQDDCDAITVFDFVRDTAFNHVSRTLAALCAMLMEPDGPQGQQLLKLLLLKHGPIAQWPLRVKAAMQVSLLLGITVLWRKLVVTFESYPWALAPAFDSTRTAAERQATLEAFFRADLCCLDMGLCRQLRKAFPSDTSVYEDLALSEFLTILFTRLVMTSTQVELQFSRLSSLTNLPHKRLGLPCLAGKAMSVTFKAWVERWRATQRADLQRGKGNRERPKWVKRHRNRTAQDLYKTDLAQDMKRCGQLNGVAEEDYLKAIQAEAMERWPTEPAATRKNRRRRPPD